jgi:hypothetical protein
MIKGDIEADIFDSPETIAQARREGYSLVDPEEIAKHKDDLEALTKNELLDIAKQKAGYEKKLATKKREEIIAWIRASEPKVSEDKPPENKEDKPPEGTEPLTRAELIQSAIARGYDEAYLDSLSDEEIAALLEPKE